MNIPNSHKPRIVVIGGGFGGINLIRKIAKETVQIVLIDRHNYHTFQPLLYQVSTAGLEPDSIAYPLRKIFRRNTDFHFRMAEVNSVDTESKTVHTSIGAVTYDHLVIATGSKTNFFGNENIESWSMPMKTVPHALDIRSLVLQNIERADMSSNTEERHRFLNFVIAGAGPTGVELAGALAEFRKGILKFDYPNLDETEMQVHLIEGSDRVLSAMSETASRKAQRSLEKLGVIIHLNTFVSDYDGTTVKTSTGKQYKTATFIWAAGVTGAPVSGVDGAALIPKANRYEVDDFNRILGMDHVYAIGDIAVMRTKKYPNGHPMVAQPAIQQGKNLGANFKRLFRGKPLLPFKYFDKGSLATIGRNKAVADIWGTHFWGPFAWFIWMFVHLWFLVGFRNRVVTFFNWTYNYINYDRAARLIIRPFRGRK